MNKYLIRFNKTRGQPGRGSTSHVWRVFEINERETVEYIVQNIKINVPSFSESSMNDDHYSDYNICCYGYLTIDFHTSTANINSFLS